MPTLSHSAVKTMSRTLKTSLSLVLLAGAASTVGCAVFANKADYRSYRSVQLANDDQDRQVAMAEYIAEHPAGQWSDEIRTERTELEPGVFEASKSTRGGLAHYIRIYPEGQFTAQAQQRLAALDAEREQRGQRVIAPDSRSRT